MEDRGLRFAIRANTMMLMIVKIGPARDVILRSPATKNLLVFSYAQKQILRCAQDDKTRGWIRWRGFYYGRVRKFSPGVYPEPAEGVEMTEELEKL